MLDDTCTSFIYLYIITDVTLPSLYNPNTGNNVYNPRVNQYFHPTGTSGLRLTQPPSMMNLPPLKNVCIYTVYTLFTFFFMSLILNNSQV